MRTVQRLIDELRKFPPDAEVCAYEGADTGLIIDGHGFIPCRPGYLHSLDILEGDGETKFYNAKDSA